MEQIDPYELLGVSPSASFEEIKIAYREAVKKYHPDTFSTPEEEAWANRKMQQINAAYAVLGDAASRNQYDQSKRQNTQEEMQGGPRVEPQTKRSDNSETKGFYRRHELQIFLVAVALFLGMQAPIDNSFKNQFANGLLNAILYCMGFVLVLSLAKVIIAGAKEILALPNLRNYVRLIVLALFTFYIWAIANATRNPWTLWKQQWAEDDNGNKLAKVGSFESRRDCLNDQWNLLKQELKQKNQWNKALPGGLGRYVYIWQGRTIFEFAESMYLSPEAADLKADYLASLEKNPGLTVDQKKALARDALLPRNSSAVSYFCEPTARNRLWPFSTPERVPLTEDLSRLGQRALLTHAEKMLAQLPDKEHTEDKLSQQDEREREVYEKLMRLGK